MRNVMLNVKELSDYLNISVSLVRKLVKKGELPHNRLGAKILFSKMEIDKWLLDHQINEKENIQWVIVMKQ